MFLLYLLIYDIIINCRQRDYKTNLDSYSYKTRCGTSNFVKSVRQNHMNVAVFLYKMSYIVSKLIEELLVDIKHYVNIEFFKG